MHLLPYQPLLFEVGCDEFPAVFLVDFFLLIWVYGVHDGRNCVSPAPAALQTVLGTSRAQKERDAGRACTKIQCGLTRLLG